MAEFQEVAEQKRRMCKIYDNSGCNGCPMSNGDCRVLNVRYTDANDVQRFENVVMAWAAEHPEPKYQSWGEWLSEIGVFQCEDGEWKFVKANDPIPADIAQKLGIEPKEG